MKFYEIDLKSIPEIIFACSVSSYNYKNSFPHTPGLLEFSVCEEGKIMHDYENGEKNFVFPGMMNTVLKDDKFKASCPQGVLQRHTTTGIIAEYEYRISESNNVDINEIKEKIKNGTILTPHILLLEDKYDDFTGIIKEISYAYTSVNVCGRFNALSKWYKLVGMITDQTMKKISADEKKFAPGAIKYTNSAKKYIKENYKNKLTVEEIAENIGISAGYLHNIFKAVTGMSVIEYVNLYKVNLVKQYVKSFNSSLKEASYQVGIDDPAYMSRLFKKVSGIGFREYCDSVTDFGEPER